MAIFVLPNVIAASYAPPAPSGPLSPYEQAEADAAALRIKARHGADAIKENMRNPESFKIVGMAVNSKTKATCYQYRAQNGFGGMNVEQSILGENNEWIAISGSSNLKSSWKKHCSSDLVTVTY